MRQRLPEIAAIVLAAGSSRRFGADKLRHSLVFHGQTLPLAACSLVPWLETFGRVSVVVKSGAENFCREIECALSTVAIDWVECPDAFAGMGASLRAGVIANREADGWVVGLADMPIVPRQALAGVRLALELGAQLAAPFSGGRRGHPPGFSSLYRAELLAIEGDSGARGILARDAEMVSRIAIDHPGIFLDIDRRADLLQL